MEKIEDTTKNELSVSDKTILITGAFGLIGKAICKGYLSHQAKVVIAGHNPADIDVINAEFEKDFAPERYLVCTLDITKPESIAQCMNATLARFGQLDVLINNAAIDAKFDKSHKDKIIPCRFEDYPVEAISKSVEVNLIGTVQMTQAACRQMLNQGAGNIINVASSYALIAPNQQLYDFGDGQTIYKPVDYVVSKSFLPNFTRYLATFYAKDNIRCNAIAPHGIFNDHDEKFLQNFSKLSPVGRMCKKSEMVGPFIFLASDASSYMTGSVLVVDGGWTAW